MGYQELSPVAKEIGLLRLFGVFPIGWIALRFSRASQDPTTQRSIDQLREILPSESAVDGDVHKKRVPADMIATAAVLAKNLPDLEHMAGPIGMEWTEKSNSKFQAILGGEFIRAIEAHKQHLHLYPVIRWEDRDNLPDDLYAQKFLTNQQFEAQMETHLLLPQTIEVSALRGTRFSKNKSTKIKDGFIRHSRKHPTVLSASYRRGIIYEMILSPVLTFNPDDTDEYIRAQLTRQLSNLEARIK